MVHMFSGMVFYCGDVRHMWGNPSDSHFLYNVGVDLCLKLQTISKKRLMVFVKLGYIHCILEYLEMGKPGHIPGTPHSDIRD